MPRQLGHVRAQRVLRRRGSDGVGGRRNHLDEEVPDAVDEAATARGRSADRSARGSKAAARVGGACVVAQTTRGRDPAPGAARQTPGWAVHAVQPRRQWGRASEVGHGPSTSPSGHSHPRGVAWTTEQRSSSSASNVSSAIVEASASEAEKKPRSSPHSEPAPSVGVASSPASISASSSAGMWGDASSNQCASWTAERM
mmetsp:Transcript_27656/g.70710  ORF Transcript_27656/g.70710 Transcript_27656/m.70710 type:complete len:199 (-) Transcript_27656:778-1374(-)